MDFFNKLQISQKIGSILLIVLLLFAFLQPVFYAVDGNLQDLTAILQPASNQHWFGTDHFGRDMLARIASAVRLSFSLIMLSVVFALFFGVLLWHWQLWDLLMLDYDHLPQNLV